MDRLSRTISGEETRPARLLLAPPKPTLRRPAVCQSALWRLGVALALLAATMPTQSAHAEDNLFPNPSAEEGADIPASWAYYTDDDTTFARDTAVAHTGKASARMTCGAGSRAFPSFNYSFDNVTPGVEYVVSVWAKGKQVRNNWGPNLSICFHKNADRLSEADGGVVSGGDIGGGDRDWTRLEMRVIVPASANRMIVVLGLHSEGTAWFDDVSVVHSAVKHEAYAATPLTLTVSPDQVVTKDFIGFGAHGDYYLTLPRAQRHGADAASVAMIEKRIEAMRPGVVLVFFNYRWWEPEEGKQTPDDPELRDLMHWLSLLHRIGTTIILTPWGDNFAYADWMGYDLSKFPHRQGGPSGSLAPRLPRAEKQPAVMRSLADFTKYARVDNGITNLRYVSTCCEPDNDNIRATNPAEFVSMHRMLDKELRQRGLRDQVHIIGPHGSGGGVTEVGRFVNETLPLGKDVFDALPIHTYAHRDTRLLPYWLRSHKAFLAALDPTKPPKPLIVAEFGYGGGTFENTENGKFEYGLFLADFGVVAAREGVSAALMWCLMDTYYQQERPGVEEPKQTYGLWRFADEGWKPRPGFYSWSLATRYARPGSRVVAIRVEPETECVPAVAFLSPKDELTVMLVNRGTREVAASLVADHARAHALRVYRYARGTMPADATMIGASTTLEAAAGQPVSCPLPAESFTVLTDIPE